MEFEKSRVYTALNADELKVGSKIIVADDIAELKERILEDADTFELTSIEDESGSYRFKAAHNVYMLAYLISEPEEKKLKWTDLDIGDEVIRKDGSEKAMVTRIDLTDTDVHIQLGGGWCDDELLAEWEKVENVQ